MREIAPLLPMPFKRARLLFVSASPHGQEPVWHERERVCIRDAFDGVVRRGVLLPDEPQASRSSVIETLDRHRPHLLHISCHGDVDGLILQDEHHNPTAVPTAWLVGRVRSTPTIRLVLLSACLSAGHADAIARECGVDAIGFQGLIGQDNALVFFTLFYTLLARGHSVASAYKQASGAVPERVAAEIVFAGGGDYRLPRPWRTWALLGVATLGLTAALRGVQGASTEGAIVTATSEGTDVTSMPEHDTRATHASTTGTSTAAASAADATEATTTTTGTTSTSTGTTTTTSPPAETSGRGPKPPPRRPVPLVTSLDQACRARYPDDSAELEVTRDEGSDRLHVRPMYEAPCPRESLCGCVKAVLMARGSGAFDVGFAGAVVRYNAVPTSSADRLKIDRY